MSESLNSKAIDYTIKVEQEQLPVSSLEENQINKVIKPIPVKELIKQDQETEKMNPDTYENSLGKKLNDKNKELMEKEERLTNKEKMAKEDKEKKSQFDIKENDKEMQNTTSKNKKRGIVNYHLKNKNVKLISLKRLYFLLLKIYFNTNIRLEDLKLRKYEIIILKEFLRRKSIRNKAMVALLDNEEFKEQNSLSDLLAQFKESQSFKRQEENMKFIFKWTLKKLRINLKDNPSFTDKDTYSEKGFYQFYFGELSEMWGIPLEVFYNPISSKIYQKKFNKEYLTRLFSSERFKRDFLCFVNKDFEVDYLEGISNKLCKTLMKFDRFFNKKDEESYVKGVKAVKKYFRLNRQCKLPWTQSEVADAIRDFNAVSEEE